MRWLVVPAVAVVLLAGVWLAGGVVTDDFRASMVLTAAWFAAAGVACVLAARRHRFVRVPLLASYGVVAAAVGAFLGLTTLRDRVVDEALVVGAPAAAPPRHAEGPVGPPARRAVELVHGRFRSGEHGTTGRAAVVRLPDGRRFLTLAALATAAGPDLRVRLAPGDTFDGSRGGAVDLGALKGNRGDQQYELRAARRSAAAAS